MDTQEEIQSLTEEICKARNSFEAAVLIEQLHYWIKHTRKDISLIIDKLFELKSERRIIANSATLYPLVEIVAEVSGSRDKRRLTEMLTWEEITLPLAEPLINAVCRMKTN